MTPMSPKMPPAHTYGDPAWEPAWQAYWAARLEYHQILAQTYGRLPIVLLIAALTFAVVVLAAALSGHMHVRHITETLNVDAGAVTSATLGNSGRPT